MKNKFLLILLIPISFFGIAGAVTDPGAMYMNLEKRIKETQQEQEKISLTLKNEKMDKEKRKNLESLLSNLEKEQKILEDRLDLLKKLDESGIITYTSPPEKE